MKPFMRYSLKRFGWYLLTFFFALFLNFYLPRLVPGNPVNGIVAQMANAGVGSEALQQMYSTFMQEFGLDQPVWMQFFNYVKLLFQGNLGTSFSQYPTPVTEIIGSALIWTLMLQIPALLFGWVIGNVLGAVAAYRKGIFDSTIFPVTLFFNSIPQYALAILLLYIFGVIMGILPVGGGYSQALLPALSWTFISSALSHYVLPFASIVLVVIGGQAIGMRSMSIYELNADYVLYSRSLGIKKNKIVQYVFRNAMLPQITGLATTLGLMIGGALVTEMVFSYPGLGTYLFSAIRQSDYPLIQGCTLIITVGVLAANFLMDLTYGMIDPRIKAAQLEEEVG